MIQKIKPAFETWDESEFFYRTGYYTFAAKDKEKLVWGQYTQLLTEHEYKLSSARRSRRAGQFFSHVTC